MGLEAYWGVGPKTRSVLASSIGEAAATTAIERGDLAALVEAGVPRGRATRILRHATAGAAMDLLRTPDTRTVYNDVLELATDHAVSPAAADRIRLLTPLATGSAMEERLAAIETARRSWRALGDEQREGVLDAFAAGEAATTELGAVRTARSLRELALDGDVFARVAELDGEALASAERALAGLAGAADGVGAGADDRLDTLRGQRDAVADLAAVPRETLAAVQEGALDVDQLREALARHVATETAVDVGVVREAMPAEASDAEEFVGTTLRTLAADRRETVEEREATVVADLEADLDAARETVDAAVAAVRSLSLDLSLARFAEAYALTPPRLVTEGDALAFTAGRNLTLVAAGEDVQPVTYGVGDHDLATARPVAPPSGDRVVVLTGANSGGKTTLLETCCQIQLLAQMGLPVPAAEAVVAPVDAIVFHRRHASFNAGVLESTLRTVVPPLVADGRTLMLVDEFEAITEPGAAADLLHGLVTLTVDQAALGVFVTHLAADLEPLPDRARTDGIFAEGLTDDLELAVDYQPRFGTVGRSTPEFIVSRLVAEAADRAEQAGYRALAEAVGQDAVQRTLADARWRE